LTRIANPRQHCLLRNPQYFGTEPSGIKPELLPAEEDMKKLERRVKSVDKEIAKNKLKSKND
jgi:hypothetical protein